MGEQPRQGAGREQRYVTAAAAWTLDEDADRVISPDQPVSVIVIGEGLTAVGGLATGQPAGGRPIANPGREYAQLRWVFREGDYLPEFAALDLKNRKKPVGGFHVAGRCPACTHQTTSIFPLQGVTTAGPGTVLAGGSPAAGAKFFYYEHHVSGPTLRLPQAKTQMVYGSIHCNCAESHDKADGRFGCGASWLLGTEIDLTARKQPCNPPLHLVHEDDLGRYWPAAEAVASAAPKALTTFQSRAAAWQTGVTGLATAAGLTALIADRTAVHGLQSEWNLAVIWAIIAATAFSAVNIGLALWVNVGFPVVKSASEAGALADADIAPLSRAAWGSYWLRWGAVAGGAAFLCGFFGLAAFFAVPDQGAGDTKVGITLYQATTTPAPAPAQGSAATPTVTPGTMITVTTTASPVCAIIGQQQPTPPASPGGTPVISVIEPNSTPSPSQATAIPIASIAAMSPGCPQS